MLGDIVSDVVTLATIKLSRKPKSEKHPYGHGRYETIGTLLVSALLSSTGVGIAWHTIESLLSTASVSLCLNALLTEEEDLENNLLEPN